MLGLIKVQAVWLFKKPKELSALTGVKKKNVKKIIEGNHNVILGDYIKVLNQLGLEFKIVKKGE